MKVNRWPWVPRLRERLETMKSHVKSALVVVMVWSAVHPALPQGTARSFAKFNFRP
ncbi:exported hypothetical protein [Verrucomicrobia bacterium]|nr:exported hypothetical protein [Verrucomicrobiota bacterium]